MFKKDTLFYHVYVRTYVQGFACEFPRQMENRWLAIQPKPAVSKETFCLCPGIAELALRQNS